MKIDAYKDQHAVISLSCYIITDVGAKCKCEYLPECIDEHRGIVWSGNQHQVTAGEILLHHLTQNHVHIQADSIHMYAHFPISYKRSCHEIGSQHHHKMPGEYHSDLEDKDWLLLAYRYLSVFLYACACVLSRIQRRSKESSFHISSCVSLTITANTTFWNKIHCFHGIWN